MGHIPPGGLGSEPCPPAPTLRTMWEGHRWVLTSSRDKSFSNRCEQVQCPLMNFGVLTHDMKVAL